MIRYAAPVRACGLAGLPLLTVVAACHVTSELESTRPGATRRIHHPEQAQPRRAAMVLAADGHLRFVEPLECPSEDIAEQADTIEVATRPNLATFVVGLIVSSAGAIATANGAIGGNGTTAGLGVAGLAVGLPFAIGPWLGLRTELRAGPAKPAVTTVGPLEPCGDRALVGHAATLTVNGMEVYGTIGADGVFAVSPFTLLDVYQVAQVTAWDVSATIDGEGPPRTLSTVIEGAALAKAAAAYLEHADFDAAVAPLRLVPTVQSGPPRISLTQTDTGVAARVVLGVHNAGPGEVYALRGQITSSLPALDGRVIYVGHLARDKGAARELLIPLSPAQGVALRGATVDISIELRDAHGTSPTTPFRFHGPILDDAPR